jgi:hypothetical protein
MTISSERAAESLAEWAEDELGEQWRQIDCTVEQVGSMDSYLVTFSVPRRPSVALLIDVQLNTTMLLGRTGEQMFSKVSPRWFFERTLLPTLQAQLAGEIEESTEKRFIGRSMSLRFLSRPPEGLNELYRTRIYF